MAVTVKEIRDWLDSLYPPHWAEEWDQVGLHLGDPGQTVRRLGVALEASPPIGSVGGFRGHSIVDLPPSFIFPADQPPPV